MFCKKCGKEIGNDAEFCENCGTPTDINSNKAKAETSPKNQEPTASSQTQFNNENIIKKKSNPLLLILIVIAVVSLLVLTVTGIAILSNPHRKYEKQLSLGARYLNNLDYEKAIAAYKTAIEIDPKNPDAYKALAEIYIEISDYEAAAEVLNDGINYVDETHELEILLSRIDENVYVSSNINETADTTTSETAMSDSSTEEYKSEETEVTEESPDDSSYTTDGEYIIFGSYEQDGDSSNGPEPIEWEIVLDEGDRMLVISRYILDVVPYNTEYTDITWENCTLRSWLNNDFYNTAFSDSDHGRIIQTELTNSDNPHYGTVGGNNTSDKLFVLSLNEVMEYYTFNSWYEEDQFGYSQQLAVEATPLVYKSYRGYEIEENYDSFLLDEGYSSDIYGKNCYFWWLRSPGSYNKFACCVNYYGGAGWYHDNGAIVNDCVGVRPALYLSK